MNDHLAERYRTMQRYLGWSADDVRHVAALRALVTPSVDRLIEDFYAEIAVHPEASRVITGGAEQVARLSQSLRLWLDELLTGPYDEGYMARRWRVGHRHVEIGLAQRYASLALARLRSGIVVNIERGWQGTAAELVTSLASLHKLLDLENALIQDAYEYEYVRREKLLERQRSERKFRRLVESANCLIVILSEDRSLAYFNPCAEQTTGFLADDLSNDPKRVLSLLGQDEEQTNERMRRVFNEGEVIRYEDQVRIRSGESRWITWTLSRLDEFDVGSATLAVGHDISDVKLAAERLLQASRLATIGEMYSGLAHESRNALQRLRACTDLLADQVGDRPSATALVERSYRARGFAATSGRGAELLGADGSRSHGVQGIDAVARRMELVATAAAVAALIWWKVGPRRLSQFPQIGSGWCRSSEISWKMRWGRVRIPRLSRLLVAALSSRRNRLSKSRFATMGPASTRLRCTECSNRFTQRNRAGQAWDWRSSAACLRPTAERPRRWQRPAEERGFA